MDRRFGPARWRFELLALMGQATDAGWAAVDEVDVDHRPADIGRLSPRAPLHSSHRPHTITSVWHVALHTRYLAPASIMA